MALNVLCRYSWFCVFYVAFLGLDSVLSHKGNGYYGYYDFHSIQRRSAQDDSPGEDPRIVHHLSTPTVVHINESSVSTAAPKNTTLKPPVVSNPFSATSGTKYNTTSNSTTKNNEDANRTSQPFTNNTAINGSSPSSVMPNGYPVAQQGKNTTLMINSSTEAVNTTAGINSPLVTPTVPTVLSTTEINDYTINEFENSNDLNETLYKHNITKYLTDFHQYYNSSFIIDNEAVGHQYWVDMNHSKVVVNEMLSQSHRRAVTVKLSFDFPFYGHVVRNVTVATGGFLYTGEYVHSWLAATQYIAPLMANFDTSISKDSYVKYMDNGTSFTVQWEKVVLQDKPNSGDFTFQATLHKNGDIVFVYQNVPVVIKSIQDDQHPVKVGLSDAYIIDRTIFFVRRKTIYEYHRVNFDRQEIKNWTVIILNALPTCVDSKDCESCLSVNTGFTCMWCPAVNRCSTGTDRHRQDWLHQGCDKVSFSNITQCPVVPTDSTYDAHNPASGLPNHIEDGEANSAAQTGHSGGKSGEHSAVHGETSVSMGISGIIGILFIVALVASLGVWALYAYRNPHTASGQFLIRYRPSQWSWKRGEARYTAATIHM